MKLILSFLALMLLNLNLLAQTQLERVRGCVEDTRWEAISCQFEDHSKYGNGGTLFGEAILELTRGAGNLAQILHEYSKGSFKSRASTPATKKKDQVVNLLRNYLSNHKVSSCQKACLLKCASANILSYEENFKSKYGSIKTIYDQEKGVCTEFASVYKDLAKQFGLESRVVATFKHAHAYNKVKIDGKWFYLEPIQEQCVFFNKTKSNNLFDLRSL